MSLPSPEWRVLAFTEHDQRPRWFRYHDGWKIFQDAKFSNGPGQLTIVEHERNDPEAIAIIQSVNDPSRVKFC